MAALSICEAAMADVGEVEIGIVRREGLCARVPAREGRSDGKVT